MTKTWFASDLHLGHDNACKVFKRPDGSPLRDFKDAEEMDEYIITEWNNLVDDKDRAYILGDCVINKKFLHKMKLLKGRKVLTPGNHDIFDLSLYDCEIRGYVVKPKHPFIASHIPIREDQIDRFGLHIHGHLHYKVVNDPRYINVSMEQIQFKPIEFSDLIARVEENKAHFEKHGTVINFADRGTR
jgi:calcineurin-like phosphoesterase family protein